MLLQASFGSWRLAAVAMLTFPMALAGAVWAALLGGSAFSLTALFGSLTVLGLTVRNGVLMTSRMHELQREGAEAFGPALVLRGARERLGPIVITTLTTALALLPLAVFGRLPGHEMLAPIAVVMLGGLFGSTLLDLYVLPILYLRFGAAREPELEFRPATAAAA
jgi:Cu/Ag efflux pump CusA